MIGFVLSLLVTLVLLMGNEWWWRGRVHGETSRKSVHIVVGTFVAFWPLFMSWTQIAIISVAFVAVVLLSRKHNIFPSIHTVDRVTWGEVFFGLAVGATALLTPQPAIFTIAILHMSLADGLAAIIGIKYGKSNTYRVLGAVKSRLGTLTFFVVSLLLLLTFSVQQSTPLGLWLPVLALGATVLENFGVRGTDNLFIPVFIALALQAIS